MTITCVAADTSIVPWQGEVTLTGGAVDAVDGVPVEEDVTGSWTVVSGTCDYAELSGSGESSNEGLEQTTKTSALSTRRTAWANFVIMRWRVRSSHPTYFVPLSDLPCRRLRRLRRRLRNMATIDAGAPARPRTLGTQSSRESCLCVIFRRI